MQARTWTLVLIGLFLSACAQQQGPAIDQTTLASVDPSATPAAALASPLRQTLPPALAEANGTEAAALEAFYRGRGFAPIWYDGGPYDVTRDRILATLADADLAPAPLAPNADTAARARHEIALSQAALRFDAAPPIGAERGPTALLDALADAVEASQPARQPAPFAGQPFGIERYSAIVAAGGWPTVPGGGSLEPGATSPRVPLLRERLQASGDYVGVASPDTVYDAALVDAVKSFQVRHGLTADGVVGPATSRALNVSASERLAQLQRAAARLDGLQAQLGERYVLVNLPAYELRYVRGGEVRHQADVIIGSKKHQTVEFSDAIDHLVFNPYWNVPSSIARNELIHDLRADASNMKARGFRVVDASGASMSPTAVDWHAVSASSMPYRIRQGPGSGNALGRVKFMFPNRHAIYLHDTPSKSLFNRSMRALSHGCIRVQDPMALAERLLEVDGVDRGTIDNYVARGSNRRVNLVNPVPVHLVYITAWVEPDGTVNFREDVYGRDHRVPGA